MTMFGWIGSFCFAACGLPQAAKSYKEGHSKGMSPLFIWLWFGGELSFLLYVPFELGWDWPLMINLTINFFVCLVILKFIYFPVEKEAEATA